MFHFSMCVAGRVAAVAATFASTRDYCAAFLCDAPPDFSVTVTQSHIDFERKKSARERALEGLPPFDYPDAYLELTAVQRQVAEALFGYDTLLFHGSVVAVDGAAYLFTAKSGTGKSTHTRLWRAMLGDRAVMVNDDKPFLRMDGPGVVACGSPWMGKHGLGCKGEFPLKAVCVLERGTENVIAPMSAKDALRMLLQQSNRPQSPALLPQYLQLLDTLAARVKFYKLSCNMEPEAARVAYEAMKG